MSLSSRTKKDRWIGMIVITILAMIIAFIPINTAGWLEFHCPHKLLLGFGCPLCGSTRAVHSIFHLNFIGALVLNPAIYSLTLFAVFEIVNLLYNGKFEKGRFYAILLVVASYIIVYIIRLYQFIVQ